MIKLCIYFHSTKSENTPLIPKTAFKRGVVTMPTNHIHGIRASDAENVYFGASQGNLMTAIKTCLKNNGINFLKASKETEFKKFVKLKEEQPFFDEKMEM